MAAGQINGPNGPFEVDFVRSHPDGVLRFSYKDDQEQFFFLAEFHTQPPINWVVVGASLGSGVLFKTRADREAVLRQNIELFFKTRRWTDPSKPGDASTAATPITFQWRIVS